MSSTPSLTRSRYIRLMAISAADILGTIPLGTFYIVRCTKIGVKPWRGWTYTHKHYSEVIQVINLLTLTFHKSSHTYVVHSPCGTAPIHRGSNLLFSFSTSSVTSVKSNYGVTVSVVATDKVSSSVSFTDQSLVSVADDLNPGFDIEKYSPSNTVTSSSVGSLHESKSAAMQDQSALSAGTMPTVPPATVPPHLPDTTKSTLRAYSGFDVV